MEACDVSLTELVRTELEARREFKLLSIHNARALPCRLRSAKHVPYSPAMVSMCYAVTSTLETTKTASSTGEGAAPGLRALYGEGGSNSETPKRWQSVLSIFCVDSSSIVIDSRPSLPITI